MLVSITAPHPEQLAAGLLQTPLTGAGLAVFSQSLKAAGDERSLALHDEWLGKPTLTSLALRFGTVAVTMAECLITVSQERNIVTTALQGRDGTVKEYISDGDYQIEVSAAILPYASGAVDGGFKNVDDRYPLSELEDMLSLLKVKERLAVQSDFLTLFGVYSAVVKSYRFAQETHSNRQSFTLSLLSDEPYEIITQKTQDDA
jgi:hypothetical protein